MNATMTIPDGTYVCWPDGCGWFAAIYRDGQAVGGTDECNMGTHVAARDSWANFDPESATEELPVELSLYLCSKYDMFPECAVWRRVPEKEVAV